MEAVQAKWQWASSANGGSGAWHVQMTRGAKTCRGAAEAWGRVHKASSTRLKAARMVASDKGIQHKQGQLHKQQGLNQSRPRRQQTQEGKHARGRAAAEADTDAEEGSRASALEETGQKTDKKEARGLIWPCAQPVVSCKGNPAGTRSPARLLRNRGRITAVALGWHGRAHSEGKCLCIISTEMWRGHPCKSQRHSHDGNSPFSFSRI